MWDKVHILINTLSPVKLTIIIYHGAVDISCGCFWHFNYFNAQGKADNPKVNAIVLVKGPAGDAGMLCCVMSVYVECLLLDDTVHFDDHSDIILCS